MSKPILEIKNLSAGVEDKQILKGVSLTISPGEVHAIMGPNGGGRARWPPCWPAAPVTT